MPPVVTSTSEALALRVGPKGFIHGWIKVDGPGTLNVKGVKIDSNHEPVPLAGKKRLGGYGDRDLHAEGEWPKKGNPRYGAVTFDNQGRVLLREPTNHFDGYHWTLPKGGPDKGEHPTQTALRETLEETGYKPTIVGHVPGGFGGTGSSNHFYIAHQKNTSRFDAAAAEANGETQTVKWADPQEALNLISQSTNLQGRYRDLQTLKAAYEEYGKDHPEHEFPAIILPPPPPKPPRYFKKNTFEPDAPDPKPVTSVSKAKTMDKGSAAAAMAKFASSKSGAAPSWVTTKGPKTAQADALWAADYEVRWDASDWEFRDYSGGHHVPGTAFHFKHGWIPLDDFADAQLAKKLIPSAHKESYKTAATAGYSHAAHEHLDSVQIAAKAAPYYAKAKKAHAEGDDQKAAEALGTAHGIMEASRDKKAEEKDLGVTPHAKAAVGKGGAAKGSVGAAKATPAAAPAAKTSTSPKAVAKSAAEQMLANGQKPSDVLAASQHVGPEAAEGVKEAVVEHALNNTHQAKTISFGKPPPGGWKESDKVPKTEPSIAAAVTSSSSGHTPADDTKYMKNSPKYKAFNEGHADAQLQAKDEGLAAGDSFNKAAEYTSLAKSMKPAKGDTGKAYNEGTAAGFLAHGQSVNTSTSPQNHGGSFAQPEVEDAGFATPEESAAYNKSYEQVMDSAKNQNMSAQQAKNYSKGWEENVAQVAGPVDKANMQGKADGFANYASIHAEEPPEPDKLDQLLTPDDGMPHSMDELADAKMVAGPTGSNPAQWYQKPDGTKLIVKQSVDPEHAYNEAAVNEVYKAAGIKTPDVSVLDNGEAVASKEVPGITPWKGTPKEQAEARKGFGIDALTSNWDALGLVNDNAFTDKDGNVVRIDNGGGGMFRAMGAPKGDAFAPGDWENNFNSGNSSKNDYKTLKHSDQGKKFYGDVSKGAAAGQVDKSLDDAANLDLNKVKAGMDAQGIPDAFSGPFLAVLAGRQQHLKDEGYGGEPGIQQFPVTSTSAAEPDNVITNPDIYTVGDVKPGDMVGGTVVAGVTPQDKLGHQQITLTSPDGTTTQGFAHDVPLNAAIDQHKFQLQNHGAKVVTSSSLGGDAAVADAGGQHTTAFNVYTKNLGEGIKSPEAAQEDAAEMHSKAEVNEAKGYPNLAANQHGYAYGIEAAIGAHENGGTSAPVGDQSPKLNTVLPNSSFYGGYTVGHNMVDGMPLSESGEVKITGPNGESNLIHKGSDTINQAIAAHEADIATASAPNGKPKSISDHIAAANAEGFDYNAVHDSAKTMTAGTIAKEGPEGPKKGLATIQAALEGSIKSNAPSDEIASKQAVITGVQSALDEAGYGTPAVVTSKSTKNKSSVMAKNLKPGDIVEGNHGLFLEVESHPTGSAPGIVSGHQVMNDGTVNLGSPQISFQAPKGGSEKVSKLAPSHPVMKAMNGEPAEPPAPKVKTSVSTVQHATPQQMKSHYQTNSDNVHAAGSVTGSEIGTGPGAEKTAYAMGAKEATGSTPENVHAELATAIADYNKAVKNGDFTAAANKLGQIDVLKEQDVGGMDSSVPKLDVSKMPPMPEFDTPEETQAYQDGIKAVDAVLSADGSYKATIAANFKNDPNGVQSTLEQNIESSHHKTLKAYNQYSNTGSGYYSKLAAENLGKTHALEAYGATGDGEDMAGVGELEKGDDLGHGVTVKSVTHYKNKTAPNGESISKVNLTSPKGESSVIYGDSFPITKLPAQHDLHATSKLPALKAWPKAPEVTLGPNDKERLSTDQNFAASVAKGKWGDEYTKAYKEAKGFNGSPEDMESNLQEATHTYNTTSYGVKKEAVAQGHMHGYKQAQAEAEGSAIPIAPTQFSPSQAVSSTSLGGAGLKAKAQPIKFTGDMESNGQPFHQHPGYFNEDYDAAYGDAAGTAPPSPAEMIELEQAVKSAPLGSQEAAEAKGQLAGAKASDQDWANTHKTDAKAKQEQEFIAKVASSYTGKANFHVPHQGSTTKPVPATIPHGVKPEHAIPASMNGYDQAIAQGYDEAHAAYLQGHTPEEINGAVQSYLDDASALGAPDQEAGILEQAHLAGLAQGAGKAAVDLKKDPEQHPNASSHSIISQGGLADKSGHGAYTGVSSGNPYKDNQSDTQFGWSTAQQDAVSTWKSNYRYDQAKPAFVIALDKIGAGQDPGNSSVAKDAKMIFQMYEQDAEPNTQDIGRKVTSLPPAVRKAYTTVGNEVEIPLTSWSTDPAAWNQALHSEHPIWMHAPPGTVSMDIGRIKNFDSEVETISGGKFQVDRVEMEGKITHIYFVQTEATLG